jgi:fumarate reductase subunit D
LIQTHAVVKRIAKNDPQSLNVTLTNPFTKIYAHSSQPISLWIMVVSIIGGLLTLLIIVFALFKAGFFKRAKKEELKQIIRHSKMISAQELDDLYSFDERT